MKYFYYDNGKIIVKDDYYSRYYGNEYIDINNINITDLVQDILDLLKEDIITDNAYFAPYFNSTIQLPKGIKVDYFLDPKKCADLIDKLLAVGFKIYRDTIKTFKRTNVYKNLSYTGKLQLELI